MALIRSSLRLLRRPLPPCLLQVRGYAEGAPMAFTLAAPNQVYYNNSNVRQVDVNSFSGSFGILPSHVPSLAVLKPGTLTVFEEDGTQKKFFASSGMISIHEDSSVQIMAEELVTLDMLDASACREALSKAQSELSAATTDEAKAEAQIAIEVAEALVKAME